MSRTFTTKEAARLIAEHKGILDRLQFSQRLTSNCVEEIGFSADAFVASEMMEVLKGIPIEEVNRDKRGIKVKALRAHGYQTIADIAPAGVSQIASIYGISQDSAYIIKGIVNEIVNQTRKNTRIRISWDKKTTASTRLISAVFSYRKALLFVEQARKLEQEYGGSVEKAVDDLSPGTSGVRWFFSSKSKKQRGENAFQYLKELLDGKYGRSAKAILDSIDQINNYPAEDAWQDFQKNSIQYFNLLENVVPGLIGSDDSVYGLPEDLAREIQDEAFFPDGLLCELRRYQEWGVKYILHQEQVLLGDEMGLGKTVQAIAAMVSLKNTGATHFLVVCPASVLSNWLREITNKSKLRVIKVHGNGRKMAIQSWIEAGGVAVTTYETTGYFKLDSLFRFSMLIVDEAHYIKNPEARRTINVKAIASRAERVLFMTGTALENKVSEMVTLIQMLQPDVANRIKGMEFLASAPQFRIKVAPVYYRRKREDVLTELPEKIENKEWCTLLAEEEAVYEEAILSKRYADARRVSWNVEDLNNSSKARRMLELIEEAADDGRKVIVFSFFLDTIGKIVSLLGNKCMEPINGSVSPARRQAIIDEFDNAPAGTVLAAQIQSGGTGLNIQSASVVIICEPQFKPSIENQAISRAYRMGQTRNVLVYRLLCENTVDEKITGLLEEKQRLFDAFADKSEAAKESLEIDSMGFGEIIKSEIDRINAKKGRSSSAGKKAFENSNVDEH